MDGREHVIVCGIDGSAAGQLALEWAMGDAIRRNCKLRVVTAWAWDGVEAIGAASSPAAAHSQAKQIQDVAVARVLADTDNPPEVERVLVRGAASEGLCTSALDAELMVLGSHGHGAVHDKLVGSTSQRAIHHASCPVVIVPDPRHAERALKHAKGKRRGAEPPQAAPMF
ncbi:MAG: universal stress protein [Nocardioidaceae bacterium]